MNPWQYLVSRPSPATSAPAAIAINRLLLTLGIRQHRSRAESHLLLPGTVCTLAGERTEGLFVPEFSVFRQLADHSALCMMVPSRARDDDCLPAPRCADCGEQRCAK